MARRSLKLLLAAVALAALGGGAWWWYESQKPCCAAPEPAAFPAPEPDRPKLGLMTSLPLYWPAGADMAAITSGEAGVPWQRRLLEVGHELVPLDTLSPIPGLSPDDPETDPLAGLERLAVIQPRGLAPADNVALDAWVRGGGHLLLVLDPLLTGEYPFALGDPRRPVDTALMPPVVARWGLGVGFDEMQPATRQLHLGSREITVSQAGQIERNQDRAAADSSCEISAEKIVAQCRVGDGTVTLVADAAVFEQRELAGANGDSIQALMDYAFD